MRRAILPIAAVLLTAACASTTPTTTPATAASSTATRPTSSPTPTAAAVPSLAVGQTIKVHANPDGVIDKTPGDFSVTLQAIKTATKVTDAASGYTATAQAGNVIGCIELKIRNVGTSPADTYPFQTAQWNGADGQTATAELQLGIDCSDLGQNASELSSTPNPAPGQFVIGTDSLQWPAGPGNLVFSDRSGTAMFTIPISK